ncbi:MAG: hypoxanthine-guanine phosphoribosyltransferase [Bradyrhizobium sp.]|uniref:hypoxanthine-guanine phosphoribosyltransferase n=1 Tax=Bradyrhizobium sp. TaxID=376 RepID=UPI003D0F4278
MNRLPDPARAWAFLDQSDLVVAAPEVDAAIVRLGGEMTRALGDTYPLVLTVMGGAVVFAGRLLPLLRFPLDLDYVHATRYGAATQGGGIEWRVAPPAQVAGRTVVVLDDILDGGLTLRAIRDRLLECGAKAVRVAVLVEKILPTAKPISADFVGLRIPDRFVFGYGMDAKGFWRNLPEIRALKE